MLALVPYFQIPSLHILDGVAIHPFGVLVATGILIGATLTRRRGRSLGLDDEMIKNMIFWSVLTGFVFAHVLDVLIYQHHPDMQEKLRALIDPRSGLSSMGGFLGAVVGLFAWCKKNDQKVLPYADSLAYGLAAGWLFGRMGCFVAHDHPGHLVGSSPFGFLGVDYPCPAAHCANTPDGKLWHVGAEFRRWDLGFIEVLVSGVLTAFYFIAERFRVRCGFFVAAIATYYGPVRFFLDYLRVYESEFQGGADPRVAGLTPAQYAALLVTAIGIYLCVLVSRRPPLYPTDPAAPAPAPAGAGAGAADAAPADADAKAKDQDA